MAWHRTLNAPGRRSGPAVCVTLRVAIWSLHNELDLYVESELKGIVVGCARSIVRCLCGVRLHEEYSQGGA